MMEKKSTKQGFKGNEITGKYGSLVNDGVRRPYSPPRLLSAEPLELSAGSCEATPLGKTRPTCHPTGS